MKLKLGSVVKCTNTVMAPLSLGACILRCLGDQETNALALAVAVTRRPQRHRELQGLKILVWGFSGHSLCMCDQRQQAWGWQNSCSELSEMSSSLFMLAETCQHTKTKFLDFGHPMYWLKKDVKVAYYICKIKYLLPDVQKLLNFPVLQI